MTNNTIRVEDDTCFQLIFNSVSSNEKTNFLSLILVRGKRQNAIVRNIEQFHTADLKMFITSWNLFCVHNWKIIRVLKWNDWLIDWLELNGTFSTIIMVTQLTSLHWLISQHAVTQLITWQRLSLVYNSNTVEIIHSCNKWYARWL